MSGRPPCTVCGSEIPADAPDGQCPRCLFAAGIGSGGSGSRAPSPSEVEAQLPGFEILSLVGQGGMGVVYKARQKALDRCASGRPFRAALTGRVHEDEEGRWIEWMLQRAGFWRR